MKRLITIALAVLALAILSVSCNKDNKKNTGVGFWKVESDNAEAAGSSSLYHAWYYYNEVKDGFDVCFSDEDVFSNRSNSNWAWVDLAKSLCGEEHSLTENLDTDDWNFCGGTRTASFFSGFSSGTVYLKVNMENNSVTFRLNGTKSNGDKIKIDYVGSAKRMDEYVTPEPML